MKEYARRKSARLKNYNYSQNGAYFLTICTKDRKMLLGSVGAGVPDGPQICLSEYGEVVENVIHSINDTYAHIFIEKYVVMPNHVHMIVSIDRGAKGPSGTPAPTSADIPALVSVFKRFVNRKIGQNIWQRSYYDHVIRGREDYLEIWKYIDENPLRWSDDEQAKTDGK